MPLNSQLLAKMEFSLVFLMVELFGQGGERGGCCPWHMVKHKLRNIQAVVSPFLFVSVDPKNYSVHQHVWVLILL